MRHTNSSEIKFGNTHYFGLFQKFSYFTSITNPWRFPVFYLNKNSGPVCFKEVARTLYVYNANYLGEEQTDQHLQRIAPQIAGSLLYSRVSAKVTEPGTHLWLALSMLLLPHFPGPISLAWPLVPGPVHRFRQGTPSLPVLYPGWPKDVTEASQGKGNPSEACGHCATSSWFEGSSCTYPRIWFSHLSC